MAYAAGVAIVVTLGLVLVYLLLTAQLRNATAQDLHTRLDDLAAAVEAGQEAALLHDPYAQLLAGGRVIARSPAAPAAPVLTPTELSTAARRPLTVTREVEGLGARAMLASQPVRGGQVVVVGASLSAVELAAERILLGLAVLGPLLVLALTLAVRRLVRRALAPVATLTTEASAITAAEADRLLPEPSGDDEIAELAATLNAMLRRLAAAQQRERAFVDDAAHELRTPVAVLRAELELGLQSGDPQEQDQALRRALAETDRLGQLSTDLLLLARARAGQLELDRRSTDVTEVVREWTARLRHVTGLGVIVTGPELVATIDPTRLEQVVTNLVGNAAQAGARNVDVRLAARAPDGVVIEVSDDGPGFPAALLPVAFERFSRGGPARTRDVAHGAGLGLAIVAALARAHGGSVEAGNDSRLGGAWVRVVLPGPPA